MKRSINKKAFVSVACMLFSSSAMRTARSAPLPYQMTLLPYSPTEYGYVLNDLGQVGLLKTYVPNAHVMIWQYGQLADLGSLPQPGTVRQLNNNGLIVGGSTSSSRCYVDGYVAGPNGIRILACYECSDINDANVAACYSLYDYGANVLTPLAPYPQCDVGPCAGAGSINSLGAVAGLASPNSHTCEYFVLDNGNYSVIFRYISGYICEYTLSHQDVSNFNDLGQVLLTTEDLSSGHRRTLLWDPAVGGNSIIAPGHCIGTDLDNCGNALLSCGDHNNYLWRIRNQKSPIVPIDSSFDDSGSWTSIDLYQLNDIGQIWGRGLRNGIEMAFLLTPTELVERHAIEQVWTVPVEGGVRANLRIPKHLASPAPKVYVFRDTNGNGTPDPDELLVLAQSVRIYQEGCGDKTRIVYFTPPSFDDSTWGHLAEGETASLSVLVTNDTGSRVLTDYLKYTADIYNGIEGVRIGMETLYDELLSHNGATEFVRLAPKAGAVAETIFLRLFKRAKEHDGDPGTPITTTLESILPQLRDYINSRRPDGFNYAAYVLPACYGQTVHAPLVDDMLQAKSTLLFSMGPGSLLLKPGRLSLNGGALSGGRFVFPNSNAITSSFHFTTPGQEWDFDWNIDFVIGLRIRNLRANRNGFGYRNVASDIAIQQLMLNDKTHVSLSLGGLSHVYINDYISDGLPHKVNSESLISALYRMNTSRDPQAGTPGRANVEQAALVVRQTVALTSDFADFEPSHCMLTGHVFPMASIALSTSIPLDENIGHLGISTGPSTTIRVDHRLAFNPEAATPKDWTEDECEAQAPSCWSDGEQWVAAVVKDKDEISQWISFAPCGGDCLPFPWWPNMFECLTPQGAANNTMPVQYATLFGSSFADNIHLEPLQTTSNPWSCDPLIQAPGAFDGAVHIHWRWSSELGADFGDGAPLFPPSQSWILGITGRRFPKTPYPDFATALETNDNHECITRSEKTVWVGVIQKDVLPNVQYETMSNGFSYAKGAGKCEGYKGYFCPLLDFIMRHFGYSLLPVGFCSQATEDIEQRIQAEISALRRGGLLADSCPNTVASASPPQDQLNSSLCAEVNFVDVNYGTNTPLTSQTLTGNVLFTTPGGNCNFELGEGMFARTAGRVLATRGCLEQARLRIDFATPMWTLYDIPIAMRSKFGGSIRLEVFSKDASLQVTEASVPSASNGDFAETIVTIEPGSYFDAIEISTAEEAVDIAVGRFDACPRHVFHADTNRDGQVAIDDASRLIACIGSPERAAAFSCILADATRDGGVDIMDFATLQNEFGHSTTDCGEETGEWCARPNAQPCVDLLVASGYSNSVNRYDAHTGAYVQQFVYGTGGPEAPGALRFDSHGDLYVLATDFDTFDTCVLRYDPVSKIFVSFIACGSMGAFATDMTFGPDGSLYVAGNNNGVNRYDGATGALLDAFVAPGNGGLDDPTALAFGPDGDLYVSSWKTNSVLRFDGSTGAAKGAFVATGTGGMQGPGALSFDLDSNLLVSDGTYPQSRGILRFDGHTGAYMGTFVGAGSGGLNRARSFAFGVDNYLYVANDVSILRYDGKSGVFIDVLVSLPSLSLFATGNLAFDHNGSLFLSGWFEHNVVKFDGASDNHFRPLVSGSGGLWTPRGLALGGDCNLYVASRDTNSILRYNGNTGDFISTFAMDAGTGAGSLQDLLWDSRGYFLLSDLDGDRVLRFDGATGSPLGEFVHSGSGGLDQPRGMVLGPDRNLYVAGESEVLEYDGVTGAFMRTFVERNSGGLQNPADAVFGPDGNFYVSDFLGGSILRYDGGTGQFLNTFVSARSGGLSLPVGLDFGPDNNLYVCSLDQVLRFDGHTGAFIDAFIPSGSVGLNGARHLMFTGARRDCNGNGIVDICDIRDGRSLDQNSDRIPDECGVYADFDQNGKVNNIDSSQFNTCLLGPYIHLSAGCAVGDIESDDDIDLADFGAFQISFGGP